MGCLKSTIDVFPALVSHLLEPHLVLRKYWPPIYFSRSLPSEKGDTGHSDIYKKEMSNVIDPTPQVRGDVNHLTFSCPSTLITIQSCTLGEGASQPSQNRVSSSSVNKKFSSSYCYVKDDSRLRWSGEDGLSRIWSQMGTGPSVSVQESLI